MALEDLEVIIEHFQSAYITGLEGNELKLNHFPKLDNGVDLFVHLCLILGDFAYFFDSFLIIKETVVPEETKFKILIDLEFLFDCIFNFFPMSAIGSDHGVMLEVWDHRDEDSPALDILTDSNEGIAFTICNLDGL